MSSLVPALAILLTASALYFSRGVLDQVLTADGAVRVALLPPWQAFGGFLLLGGIGWWLMHRWLAGRARRAILPLFGLSLLLLPYLPGVADWMPALQILAGPARAIVWLVVLGQLFWVAWERLPEIAPAWAGRLPSTRRLMLAIGVTSALVIGGAASRLAGTVLYPGGDEPHYLVIAQSLWRDGDLKIENNHRRGDYREYFGRDLEPHYLTRGADQEIYSIHPIGMPVLMAPVYALGGYIGVVAAFGLLAACAAAIMWRTSLRSTSDDIGTATFAWAAVVLTAPFLYNAFAVYPEIPAALAVAIAFTLAALSNDMRMGRWLTVGTACATLPWLSTKYAPMSAALVALALGRIIWPGVRRTTNRNAVAAAAGVVVPYGVSLLGWFYFFYRIWGKALPQAPYGALVQTELPFLLFGAPGLMVDQEYGLLPYAPVYLLALTGMWHMWRSGDDTRRRACELAVVFAALLGTVGAFRIWWGGSASPGRPLTSGLLLLMLPVAAAFHAAPAASARRAAQHVLLWVSIGIAATLLMAQEGLLTANGRDGTSSLLEYLSPRWPAWSAMPSFIYHEPGMALRSTFVWLLLAAAAAAVLSRGRSRSRGGASLTALTVLTSTVLLALLIVPRLPVAPAWPNVDLRARARLPLLDRFDSTTRPIALELSPLRLVSAAELSTRAALGVQPGLRRESQPLKVLLNGRFSLPAGVYRVEIEWSESRVGESIALQVGRIGDPWLTWPVAPHSGERWQQEFTLPMDAGFVGLRGSVEVERAIKQVRIVPVSVVDLTRRPRVPAVIAAGRSGLASLFFYDIWAMPDSTGFWVAGQRSTLVTFQPTYPERPLTLSVHSGPIANRLRLSAPGWTQDVTLEPAVRQRVVLPFRNQPLITVQFVTEQAFVPRQLDPASTDQRALGVWVEVVE